MASALAHRGPDDFGLHLAGPLGLAQHRLSIIDLEHGHQPMVDGRFALVANGEIYNFIEPECSRSRCTMPGAASSCWRAIVSASSLSTTLSCRTGSCSPRS